MYMYNIYMYMYMHMYYSIIILSDVYQNFMQCFKIFTSYDFSPFQDRLYDSVVWPQVCRSEMMSLCDDVTITFTFNFQHCS